MKRLAIALAALSLSGCVAYTLVPANEPSLVGDNLTVQPGTAWNAVPSGPDQTKWEETWTRNGPLLETVGFIGGLPEGKALRVQKKKTDRQVPIFRADMSPQDLVSMVEASYRTRGVTVFDVQSVDPVDFLGGKGVKMAFTYAPNDGISKKGSAVIRVVDKKLYVVKLDGVSSHYFDAAVPDFEKIVATAKLGK